MRMLYAGLFGLVVFGCATVQRGTDRTNRTNRTDRTNRSAATVESNVGRAAAGSEFDFDRLHAAGGRFVTRDVFAANADRSLADVLREYIVGFGDPRDARASTGGPVCALEVYLDGLRIIGNLDGIRPAELAGAEYYQTGTAPLKYRRAFSSCPVLVLWLNK